MSDEHLENRPESAENTSFIRETVESPRRSRRRTLLLRIVILLVAAVVFGLVAALTMVLSSPWMKEHFGEKEPAPTQVVIPRDPVETDAESAEAKDEEALRAMVKDGVRAYMETFTAEIHVEAEEKPDILVSASDAMSGSIVTVSSRRTGEDVFKNTYTRSDQTFGLIVAKTDTELMVLTESALIEDAGVFVTFMNETVNAVPKAVDPSYAMAVVCAERSAFSEDAWEMLVPASLGNSYMMRVGDSVAVLGAPLGYSGSMAEGRVAYINTLQPGKDMNFQVIQTDIAADRDASGILVNSQGQVVGWVMQAYNPEGMENLLSAVSISDIKGLIENMTNGKRSAYLGIQFRTVGASIAEEHQMPMGIYITKCMKDSPAYGVGIRNGDVLTALGEKAIYNEFDFERTLESMIAGNTVVITIQRQGRSGYTEMKYEVVLGAR